MKLPMPPPNLDKLLDEFAKKGELQKIVHASIGPTTKDGRYLHWDKLRYLTPPEGCTTEMWWVGQKIARRAGYRKIPLTDKYQQFWQFTLTDRITTQLFQIDAYAHQNEEQSPLLSEPQLQTTLLISSLIEEAITSSQLEGAATTRHVAKEMLRTQRKPRDTNEQMIYNNYQAMQFIQDIKTETLSLAIIQELQKIVTENTLPKEAIGQWRQPGDNIQVIDVRDGTILHEPPTAEHLLERLQQCCDFANDDHTDTFIHPILKAILLHFVIAYEHPFIDGNGRTARALFYWYLLRSDYDFMQFISISRILKKTPTAYGKAFLYSETDEQDLTYFIIHQLDVIMKAIDSMLAYLASKQIALRTLRKILADLQFSPEKFNPRQIMLLEHSLKHPDTIYTIEGHRHSHNVTYDTARTDLLKLAELELLQKKKSGKTFIFKATKNMQAKFIKLHPKE